MTTPSRRSAVISLVAALVIVIALVLAAGFLAGTHHHRRPPHHERPVADVTQEHSTPAPSLTALEVNMFHDYLTRLPTIATSPPPTTTAAPAPPSQNDAPTPLDNPDGFLACVRARESGGDYTIHELSGASQAAGAYQFLPSTWDSIARAVGRFDLVGLDPAAASPADQDAMAQALYDQQGAAPWGGGC